MSNSPRSAGDYIAAKCTKCKALTNHTIVAMVGDKVVRVECNTCGSVHNYRGESAKRSTPAAGTARRKAGNVTKNQREWDELQDKAQSAEILPYNMNTPMKEGMLIQHPSFGLGQVLNCIRPNKMEVRFEAGVKLLRCRLD